MPLTIPRFDFAQNSETGPVRARNEDRTGVFPELGLFILADGMGGQKGGDVASSTAVHVIKRYVEKSLPGILRLDQSQNVEQLLELTLIEAIKSANGAIRRIAAQQPQYKNMGSTVVCGLMLEDFLAISHVGDSRLYQLANDHLSQLTVDHSLYQEYLDKFGKINETIPRNIITQALGKGDECAPQVAVRRLTPGEWYFCSSDGLHDFLFEDEMLGIMTAEKPIKQKAHEMVERAFSGGSEDNASIVIIAPGAGFSGTVGWLKKIFRNRNA